MMKFGGPQNVQQRNELYGVTYAPNALSESAIRDIEHFAQKAGVQPAQVGGGGAGHLDTGTRRSNVAWLDPATLPKEIPQHFEQLFVSVNQQHYRFDLVGFESFQFTIYDESVAGEYKWHIDTAPLPDGMMRKLSMSILLSDADEYEGGRIILSPNGNHVVAEERKGRAVFFPSWMPHCVTPVTKGVRKSLVIWAHGPAFK